MSVTLYSPISRIPTFNKVSSYTERDLSVVSSYFLPPSPNYLLWFTSLPPLLLSSVSYLIYPSSATKVILHTDTSSSTFKLSMACHFLVKLIRIQELYILKTSIHLRIFDCIPPSTSKKEHSN